MRPCRSPGAVSLPGRPRERPCSRREGALAETSTSAQPGTTSISNDNATWDDGYRAAGLELKKITGYALRPLSNPSVTSYQQVVQMTLQTSKATDLVKWASGYQLKRLARAGGLTDLSGVWRKYVAKGWVRGASRDAVSYRGKVYGIPLYESYYVLFYSKPVFKKLGLSEPAELGRAAALRRGPQAQQDHAVPRQSDGWLARDRVVPGAGHQGRPALLPEAGGGRGLLHRRPGPPGDGHLARLHTQGLDDRRPTSTRRAVPARSRPGRSACSCTAPGRHRECPPRA